ncbi:MAG: hypothetical protein LBS05_09105 [Tannerellaceae bacterium]|jgi:hypothetical protein|nr:hypothetical protein [Tannerellaceae bacterium]
MIQYDALHQVEVKTTDGKHRKHDVRAILYKELIKTRQYHNRYDKREEVNRVLQTEPVGLGNALYIKIQEYINKEGKTGIRIIQLKKEEQHVARQ